MEWPEEARRRIAEDRVVWLTTVTDRGVPAPNPVWFVADGDDVVIFTSPEARRLRNIEQRPHVSLHFNSDVNGGDVVVITGPAEATPGRTPSTFPGYLDKYGAELPGLSLSTEQLDSTYHVEVRIHPTRVRLT